MASSDVIDKQQKISRKKKEIPVERTAFPNHFLSLPREMNAQGKPRTYGFEFEYAGLGLTASCELLVKLLGGKIERVSQLVAQVLGTELGDFTVELDAGLVKKLVAYLHGAEPDIPEQILGVLQSLSQLTEEISRTVVPFEIVTPPLRFEQLQRLEDIRQALYHVRAEGTRASFLNAFGLQINPEAPQMDSLVLRDYLCAFLILYPWLRSALEVDYTRRIVTFVDPFPEAYVLQVLDPYYKPNLVDFIADYLKHNPTRNRALDMLPLFAHLQPQQLDVITGRARELIKARPTFHYRLPNSEFDNPSWRIAHAWNSWVVVERLAENKEALALLAEEYRVYLNQPFHRLSNEWVERCTEWVGRAKALE